MKATTHNAGRAADLASWVRLGLATGPVLAHRLLAAFGSPDAVFAASARELQQVEGLGPSRVARLLDHELDQAARAELTQAEAAGLDLLPLDDPRYPPHLRLVEYPPLVLWCRGRLLPEDRLALAIVGPRQPSAYARQMADQIARPLAARGIAIVSGMAYGIDAEAHRAALESGGRTLAVLGQGLATPIYPRANAAIAQKIVAEDRGALLSVFPCATEPGPGNFPVRNEIIAGIALGVLVVEAGPDSGALITARHAAANRPVMACPADATRRSAQGSNRLIRDGAILVQSVDDVLEALAADLRREMLELGVGPAASAPSAEVPAPAVAPPAAPPADPLARLIFELVREEPRPADLILERCACEGHGMPAVLERLLQLEMDGRLRQLPGRLYSLKNP